GWTWPRASARLPPDFARSFSRILAPPSIRFVPMKACLLYALLVAGSTSFAAVPQWPQFRGPNSSGVAENDKPPVEFGPGTNLLWKIEVPAGLSSPCVWGDRIFLTAADAGKMLTLAVNRSDGKILWRKEVSADKPKEIHKKN